MNGLFIIALKLLVNDRGKFYMLILGITFAVFLMLQMTSAFFGAMQRTGANIINIGAKIWVMDPSVNIQADNIPLPDYILDAVRSIKGVKYAEPVYAGSGLARLNDGTYQSVSVIGLDDATLLGRPELIEGNIGNIYDNDAYIVIKDTEYYKLHNPKIGTTFEINDHRGVIVGIGKLPSSSLFGTPVLYTTYSRAATALPQSRKIITYILVEPKTEKDVVAIKDEVKKLGYIAFTKDEFLRKNTNYYVTQTGFGTNLMIMTFVSFIIGLSIAGQTFYTFVLENISEYGALKAIGAQKSELIKMIFLQSAVVGFLGYGFGVLLASLMIAIARLRLPEYASVITYLNLAISFLMVIIIVTFSSYLGIRKVINIDPFTIFRS